MGGLIGLINKVYEGKRERAVSQTHWQHRLGQRDLAIKKVFGSNID